MSVLPPFSSRFLPLAVILPVLLLAGCAARSPAWVEDRSIHRHRHAVTVQKKHHGRRPAHHTVRKGDTLYGIAFRYGLRFQDLARWNGIRKPYVIHPGQKLRLWPPRKTARVKATPGRKKPVTASPAKRTTSTPATTGGKKKTSRPATAAAVKQWHWPVRGRLLSTFRAGDPARQGINIGVEPGTAVKAAAAGKVVYSGNGLRGYGELVIIKHNDTWLTAYGHNRKRKVAEGQQVRAGQVIAESGSSEAPQPMLHFEIRRQGKPVDPLKYLP